MCERTNRSRARPPCQLQEQGLTHILSLGPSIQTLTAGLTGQTQPGLFIRVAVCTGTEGGLPAAPGHTHLQHPVPGEKGKADFFGVRKVLPTVLAAKCGWRRGRAAGRGLPGMYNELLIRCQLASQSTLQRGILFSLVWR